MSVELIFDERATWVHGIRRLPREAALAVPHGIILRFLHSYSPLHVVTWYVVLKAAVGCYY